MQVICQKPMSIEVGMWSEYTGANRQDPLFYGAGPFVGQPNWKCAPNTITLTAQKVSTVATASLPLVHPANWGLPCVGCAFTDTALFNYSAWGRFVAPVPGTCLVVWANDIEATIAVGNIRMGGCMVLPGVFGQSYCLLYTWVNGVLADTQQEQAIANYVTPHPHVVASHNLSRVVAAGDVVEYLFQVVVACGDATVHRSSAEFSFTPTP